VLRTRVRIAEDALKSSIAYDSHAREPVREVTDVDRGLGRESSDQADHRLVVVG